MLDKYNWANNPIKSKKPFRPEKYLFRIILVGVLLGEMFLYDGTSMSESVVVQAKAAIVHEVMLVEDQVFLPLIMSSSPLISSGEDWPMLAANYQRTSWTREEVRGNLAVDWYRPIEPYIHYKIQPIAANGRLYISTARGLYAFSASNGDLMWVYPTELPLGHSPTIASIDGKNIVFVGGYDHKIHAIDAISGKGIIGYTPFEAAAGFETNPLVVNNTIYAGNRDGHFYALDAVTGVQKWKYKTGGPILFSAAYKDGVIYFASNDAHAYAINANNGALIWKSQKLLGSGFHTYWPVIFKEPSTGKDYVVFTSGENYRFSTMNLVIEESDTIYNGIPDGQVIGPMSTSIPGDWVPGTVAVDASILTNYFENKPYRRTVFVLDAKSGQEFTFDSDGDGQPEYAPFNWSGVTHSGSKYPPVINSVDGVYYQATGYLAPGWISRGGPVGWKFGTQYISRIDGVDVGFASDEPLAYSSGGKLIYYVLCCDRMAGAMDVTIPYGQPDRAWGYFGYNLANNVLAPGYQQMYDGGNPEAYNSENGWQVYSGKDQSPNGVYGKHGTTQSPPIPHQGKLFFLKGNALIAFSPNGTNPKTPLPLATIVPAQSSSTSITKTLITQRLESEIQKMISAGPLRPGYHDSGFIDLYGNGNYVDEREFGEIFDYFQNPADTVYTLLAAYPHLSPSTQQQVISYLQTNYGPGAKYDFTKIAHIGWGSGAAREVYDVPPRFQAGGGNHTNLPMSHRLNQSVVGAVIGNPSPFSFYAAWQYAQVVGDNDPAIAKNIFDQMSSKLDDPLSDDTFTKKPYWLNLYLAGYQGYLELQQLAGYQKNQKIVDDYQHMLDIRVNVFSKDTPYPPIGTPENQAGETYNNSLAVARNFMFLTPELAEYLNQHIYTQVQDAIDEYEYVAPYWFVSKFDDSYGEGTFQHLYDYPALFQAKAYILNQSYDELVKWLDIPAFYQGDLFYIQNLVAALNASEFN